MGSDPFGQFQHPTVPLEPFRTLELELLLHHAQQAAVDGFLTGYLADHPLVHTDPLPGLR